jgi:hypothetical protein
MSFNQTYSYPLHEDNTQSDVTWYRVLIRSETFLFSEHSQNETEPQSDTPSNQSSSFDTFQLNSPLELEANRLLESVSRIRDPGSNCSSVCFSASLSSSTICAQPYLSSATGDDAAPSLDIMTSRPYCDTASLTSSRLVHSVRHTAGHTHSISPLVGGLSLGNGLPVFPRVSAQEHGIEEFSLGSGYPG